MRIWVSLRLRHFNFVKLFRLFLSFLLQISVFHYSLVFEIFIIDKLFYIPMINIAYRTKYHLKTTSSSIMKQLLRFNLHSLTASLLTWLVYPNDIYDILKIFYCSCLISLHDTIRTESTINLLWMIYLGQLLWWKW